MRKFRIIGLICLVIPLMAIFPDSTIQADPLVALDHTSFMVAKKHPVPFKAVIHAGITSMVPGPSTYVTVDGSGNATHLGKFAFHLEEVITGSQSVQSVTYTAANGDALTVSALSNITPISEVPLILKVEGTGQVTGGSGRFDDATGSLAVTAIVNLATGSVEASVSGVINY